MKWKPKVEELLLNKSAAEKRRIEQREVAKVTGLPEATISRWMNTNGFLRFESDTAFKLAEYFGVHWSELVELAPETDESEDPEHKTRSAHAA